MSPGLKIIQRIKDHVEALEPLDIEVGVLDIGMVGLELDVRVEFPSSLLRDLSPDPIRKFPSMPSPVTRENSSYRSLGLLDMLHPE
jgi:hypothetical protein